MNKMNKLKKEEYPKEYYDNYFKNSEGYRLHYSELDYYPLWKRAVRICGNKIFEIGCGSGQFANMVSDAKKEYFGFDISSEAISIATSLKLPYTQFAVRSFEDYIAYPGGFDTYVAFEVLEHVKDGQGLLMRIPEGKMVIFTVPNFDYRSHVRYFTSKKEILDRYGYIVAIIKIQFDNKWFLCHGIRKNITCQRRF